MFPLPVMHTPTPPTTPPSITNWEKKKDEKRGQDFAGIQKVYTVQFSKTATFFKICMQHRKSKNLKR